MLDEKTIKLNETMEKAKHMLNIFDSYKADKNILSDAKSELYEPAYEVIEELMQAVNDLRKELAQYRVPR